jgi:hypothetical protein
MTNTCLFSTKHLSSSTNQKRDHLLEVFGAVRVGQQVAQRRFAVGQEIVVVDDVRRCGVNLEHLAVDTVVAGPVGCNPVHMRAGDRGWDRGQPRGLP